MLCRLFSSDFGFLCKSLVRLLHSSISRAMVCFIGCFRGRDDNRRQSQKHLLPDSAVPKARVNHDQEAVSRNHLSSLFLTEETIDIQSKDVEAASSDSPRNMKDLKEEVMRHFLSSTSLVYFMFSCQGQLYTCMVLISEITIPIIILRWYLEIAAMKKSKVCFINGVVLFFAWLCARIFWFVYIFYHVYLHFDQVRMMHNLGIFLLIGVPAVLGLRNLVWFGKIYKGMMKTVSLSRHHV